MTSPTRFQPRLIEPFGLAPLSSDALDRNHLLAAGRNVDELAKPTPNTLNTAPAWVSVFDAGVSPAPYIVSPYCVSKGKQRCDYQASSTALRGSTAYVAFCGTCRNTFGDTARVHAAVGTNVKVHCKRAFAKKACWHLAAGRGLPKRRIAGIAFDPVHPSTVYVGLQDLSLVGYNHAVNGRARVMVSHNAGRTFHNISGNLPMANVWGVVLRNSKPIIATDVGVFTAGRNSSHWQRLGTGLPQIRVQDVRLDTTGRHLVATMYGRGAWVYDFTKRAGSGTTVTPPGYHQPGSNVQGSHTPMATTGVSSGLAVLALGLVTAGLVVRRRERLTA